MSGTTEPTLADDVDKVLLLRLHPGTGSISDAADAAMAQGTATAAAGATLEASQWEPVAGAPAKPEAPTAPPVNRDVPHVQQAGDQLTCTMGNWDGEPTGYAYQWKRGAANVGTNAATYAVTAPDVGTTMTCVVTATNALGSTAAPPSNGVVVTAP